MHRTRSLRNVRPADHPPMSRYANSRRSPFPTTPSSSVATSESTLSPSNTRRMHYDQHHDKNSPLQLSPLRKRYMLTQINATIEDALESMVGNQRPELNWRSKGVRKDVLFYADANVRADQHRFCCVSETTARSEEIITLFLMTDAGTLLKKSRMMYKNVLETRVYSVLESPTHDQPYNSVSLRYSSYAAPKPLHNRDLCVVVATNVIPQDDGSTIGYCLWDSVKIPECPDYQKSRGLVRSRMFRSGFFCRTTYGPGGDAQTKIAYLVGIEAAGAATPKFAARLLMEKSGKVLSRLCNYFRRKHLDPTTFRPRSEWPSARHAKKCCGCAQPLRSGFTARHHCGACGEVFCRSCYTKDQVDLPGVGLTTVRFCVDCLWDRGLEPPKSHEISVFERAALAVLHLSHAHSPRWFRFADAPQLLDSSAYLATLPR